MSETHISDTLAALNKNAAFAPIMRRSLAFDVGEYLQAFPLLEPYCAGAYENSRKALYFVAALYALHPRHSPERALAQALRRVAAGDEGAYKRRFMRLLQSDLDQLFALLPQEVRRLSNTDSFDYNRLYKDLLWWENDDGIALRWAKDFFRYSDKTEENNND